MANNRQEDAMLQIAQMRADHNKKVVEIRKKRFARMITNIIVAVLLLTGIGVGMSSVGYMKVYIFFVIALLPGILAMIGDKRAGRFASKTVLAFNISGMCPHIASIAYSGSPNQSAIAIVKEMDTWVLIYGFAAFGWAMVFIVPYIAEVFLEIKAAYTVKRLDQFKKSLLDEWGDEIKK